MPLKHAILGLLNYAEMTGYDIDRYFKSSIAFFWHAQTSQIYKELNTCTKHNWVDSEIVYQSDKPNKKVFHITEEGRLELHRWLADADQFHSASQQERISLRNLPSSAMFPLAAAPSPYP